MGDDSRLWLAAHGKSEKISGPSGEALESSHAQGGASSTNWRVPDFRSQTARESNTEFDAFQHERSALHGPNAILSNISIEQTDSNPALMERAWQQNPHYMSVKVQQDGHRFIDAIESELHAPEAGAPSHEFDSMRPLVHLEETWRPPSPSQGLSMSREQYAMHENLAKLQTGTGNDIQPFRQAESIQPPEDDAALEEGVYARTPEAALESVWNPQKARMSRVAHFREATAGSIPSSSYTKVRGQAIVDRLRGWLVREGYADEVYGLPPLTAKMFGEATMDAPDAKTEERRATAIRRLDALYRHLSISQTEKGDRRINRERCGASEMEAWLQKNH